MIGIARILEVYLNSYVDWSPKTIQIASFIILFIIIFVIIFWGFLRLRNDKGTKVKHL